MKGMDSAISDDDWETSQFRRLLQGLPPSIPMFSDAAACPWCGSLHTTITIGRNQCQECGRAFFFGFPPWGARFENLPESYVHCPHKEFEEMGKRGDILPVFKPNGRLTRLYGYVAEMAADEIGHPQSSKLN
jgi:hypothetical protein